MKALHIVVIILLIIGGLNWGLYAFGINLVSYLGPILAKIVYVLVGLSALWEIFTHKASCKACASPAAMPKSVM